MSESNNRRELVFKDLNAAIADARNLLATGYRATGKWNLAQICCHLNEWAKYPVDGYPPIPIVLRPLFWVLRNTIMPGKLRKYLAENSFPAGKPTMPATVFKPGECGDIEAVDRLAATYERFRNHRGPWHPSPMFGPMDGATHLKLQLVHAAHHLSFLVANNG